jgi:outer membrane protein OmpA-like peptidoglycan-associated protein
MKKILLLFGSALILNFSSFGGDAHLHSDPYKRNSKNSKDSLKGKSAIINPITKGNFLVVGSFNYQANAQNFARILKEKSLSANLGFYKGSGHYYVYLFESTDLNVVRSKRDQMRLKEEFKDAWVLKVGDKFASKVNSNGSEVIIAQHSNSEEEELPYVKAEVKKEVETDKNVKQFKVYLNTVEATTYREVPANLKMIYGEEGKLAGTYQAHQAHMVEVPVSYNHDVQFVCEVFGYKKIEQDINFTSPISESSKSYTRVVNDTIMMDFELVRYKKGEIFTMFNVFFYNDAAIMLPKSTYELNELVRMVKENNNLVIKLHGHTNGAQYGKIIKLAEDDNDYFNLKPSNVHTKGSAKDLSYERASIIKKYLIEEGIDEKRIEIKGWGGTKMLYPAKSPDAKKNVRVEIEILRD